MDKATILIVEDNPVNIQALVSILHQHYQIKCAKNLEDARKLLAPALDLILLDLYLDDERSIDFISEVKQHELFGNIPIVCVSASNEVTDIEEAFRSGALDYIIKPPNETIILSKIRTLLDLRSKTALLEQAITTDPLTGVGNRRHFQQTLDYEWRRCCRHNTSLTLVVVDIDYFKSINDTHGHLVGDQVIAHVAKTLCAHVRRSQDTVTRYGGDEFALILPDMEYDELFDFLDRIRQKVADVELTQGVLSGIGSISTTMGAALTFPVAENNAKDLLAAADEQLYRGKESDRGCVCTGRYP